MAAAAVTVHSLAPGVNTALAPSLRPEVMAPVAVPIVLQTPRLRQVGDLKDCATIPQVPQYFKVSAKVGQPFVIHDDALAQKFGRSGLVPGDPSRAQHIGPPQHIEIMQHHVVNNYSDDVGLRVEGVDGMDMCVLNDEGKPTPLEFHRIVPGKMFHGSEQHLEEAQKDLGRPICLNNVEQPKQVKQNIKIIEGYRGLDLANLDKNVYKDQALVVAPGTLPDVLVPKFHYEPTEDGSKGAESLNAMFSSIIYLGENGHLPPKSVTAATREYGTSSFTCPHARLSAETFHLAKQKIREKFVQEDANGESKAVTRTIKIHTTPLGRKVREGKTDRIRALIKVTPGRSYSYKVPDNADDT